MTTQHEPREGDVLINPKSGDAYRVSSLSFRREGGKFSVKDGSHSISRYRYTLHTIEIESLNPDPGEELQ
jgi:hypothetical protein